MLASAEISIGTNLVKDVFRLNQKFGGIPYAGYAFGHRKANEEMP